MLLRIGSLALLVLLHNESALVNGFATPRVVAQRNEALQLPGSSRWALADTSSSTPEISSGYSYDTLFGFSDPETGEDAVSKFDRIDDAIMGGISTSSIRFRKEGDGEASDSDGSDNKASSYAIWSGICRLDGGGFCGTRTLPFVDGTPLEVGADKEGLYLVVRLASDDEPEKRVWKMTTRDKNNARSEQLYQAEFQIPKPQSTEGDGSWETIRVPFSSFVQVRGPRKIENGPPLDPTGGLFQIGMSLSKFKIASNTTELPDFRPGYFQLQIREIGLYGSNSKTAETSATTAASGDVNKRPEIRTVTKKEAEQQRPVVLKVVFPILKLFFSEQRNRRKSATRILKSRGLNKFQIALFGIRRKAACKGIVWALGDFLVRSLSTTVRFVSFWTIKLALFYPLVTIRKIIRKVSAAVSSKRTPNGSEALR